MNRWTGDAFLFMLSPAARVDQGEAETPQGLLEVPERLQLGIEGV